MVIGQYKCILGLRRAYHYNNNLPDQLIELLIYQELAENSADSSHFNTVHSPPDFLGTVLKKMPFYNLILKYFYLDHDLTYKLCAEPYVAQFKLRTTSHLGPFQAQFLTKTNIIGPNLAFFKIYLFGEVYFILYFAIMSVGPLNHRLIWHYYSKKNSLLSYLISIYACHFLGVNVCTHSPFSTLN